MMSGPVTIMKHANQKVDRYSITFDPRGLVLLAKAIAGAGRNVDGYVVEAILVRLSEIGDPSWANELIFDSESEVCSVRCTRKAPLVHLVRRFEKRLAGPGRLRRLVESLPEE